MPDFEVWANQIYEGYNIRTSIKEALKQAFEQGYSLGYGDALRLELERMDCCQKEELTNTQDWWEAQDSDEQWVKSHDVSNEEITQEEALTLRSLVARIEPLVKDVVVNLDEPLPEED